MRRLLVFIIVIVAMGCSAAAVAHFRLNLNVRIVHVEHLAKGLDVYVRLPMPYLVADKLGVTVEGGLPKPAPFTTNARRDGKLVHYLDPEQLQRDPLGLATISSLGHDINADGVKLKPQPVRLRVYARGSEPSFATLTDAKASLSRPQTDFPGVPPYVGDTIVDMLIRYNTADPVYVYSIASNLNPGLPGQEETANLILDYGPGGVKVYRARGLLSNPVDISRSAFAAITTFIDQGFRHILSGLDHVLFVVCLVLGATHLRGLIGRVTGFTIGHSITLISGFFGFVPTGAWFVPAVELGIALSIIYAAYIAIRQNLETPDTLRMFIVTSAIGLLHGLGFSFVLHEILRIDSPDLWQSLIAFNVGVEFGQMTIILLVWPVFLVLARVNENLGRVSRMGTAALCALVAAYWAIERIPMLIAA
jgi:hypothetical protein